ncbi:hypothetical protein SMACR_12825 [Sordaria macrospora]|uniref:Lactate/malate dehydrogenase N-terminal domain-containing protein n=1 Tax=Sordaria macrospora TaxID=5147 RepID=A0A8S9A1T2_SORMA|nr:hypothetical protein SMACR_12825 [Sordaria macrospora]WPJ66823.1 hypothetical protein SMAC4_12825 [Sordaria macrospora]
MAQPWRRGVCQKLLSFEMFLNMNPENGLLEKIVPQIAKHAPNTIRIVATNPCDVLTKAAQELRGLPCRARHRIRGAEGIIHRKHCQTTYLYSSANHGRHVRLFVP